MLSFVGEVDRDIASSGYVSSFNSSSVITVQVWHHNSPSHATTDTIRQLSTTHLYRHYTIALQYIPLHHNSPAHTITDTTPELSITLHFRHYTTTLYHTPLLTLHNNPTSHNVHANSTLNYPWCLCRIYDTPVA